MPEALTDVVSELRKTFAYNQFRLLDTVFLRCRAGDDAKVKTVLPPYPGEFELSVDDVEIMASNADIAEKDHLWMGTKWKHPAL